MFAKNVKVRFVPKLGQISCLAAGLRFSSNPDVVGKPVICGRKGTAPRCSVIQKVLQNRPEPLALLGQKPLLEGCTLLASGGGRFKHSSPAGVLALGAYEIPQQSASATLSERTVIAEFLSVSWIDERADLPGWDTPLPEDGAGPPPELDCSFLDAGKGFRFAHCISMRVEIKDGKILDAEWLPAKQHYNPATYFIFPANGEKSSPNIEKTDSRAVIHSTVMSRTTAPEGIGGCFTFAALGARAGLGLGGVVFGCALGATSISKFKLMFPPIWTTLALSVDSTGNAACELVACSLFPSVSLYSRLVTHEEDRKTPFRRFL